MSTETRQALIRSAALLGVKSGAYIATGSTVLMAGMVDSVVDVVASAIAYLVKPKEHYQAHQLALVQSMWIVLGGLLVMVESIKALNEPVEMATVGIGILLLTVAVDGTIIRNLSKSIDPVVIGLREDIAADVTNSIGGLVALSLIAMGAPFIVDKLIAMVISVALVVKGTKLFMENMEEASNDHQADHDATPEIEEEGFPHLEA